MNTPPKWALAKLSKRERSLFHKYEKIHVFHYFYIDDIKIKNAALNNTEFDKKCDLWVYISHTLFILFGIIFCIFCFVNF